MARSHVSSLSVLLFALSLLCSAVGADTYPSSAVYPTGVTDPTGRATYQNIPISDILQQDNTNAWNPQYSGANPGYFFNTFSFPSNYYPFVMTYLTFSLIADGAHCPDSIGVILGGGTDTSQTAFSVNVPCSSNSGRFVFNPLIGDGSSGTAPLTVTGPFTIWYHSSTYQPYVWNFYPLGQCPLGYGGTVGSCTLCLAGQFVNGAGQCAACSAGSFSSTAGSASCEPCPAGSAVGQSGAAYCPVCSANFYSTQGSSSCSACPANAPFSLPGSTSSNSCCQEEGNEAAIALLNSVSDVVTIYALVKAGDSGPLLSFLNNEFAAGIASLDLLYSELPFAEALISGTYGTCPS